MPDFDVESLRRGIISSENNIKTFKEAIDREKETIADYQRMISFIEKKKTQKSEARANVKIEVEKG